MSNNGKYSIKLHTGKIHQVISNLVQIFDLNNYYLDWYESWEGILSVTDFEVQIKHHTLLQAMLEQLVLNVTKY